MDNRYHRQQLISDWRQDKLEEATVVILGMGALGNEISRILVMSGVKNFIICDPDHIEISNLSRTLLFRDSDIGRLKVEAAAEALKDLAPNVQISERPTPLVHGVGLAELRDASLVLGCLDSRAARLQLAGRCQLVNASFIDGGTTPWGGEVRPYLKKDITAPCYGCGLSKAGRAIADIPWHCLDPKEQIKIAAAAPSSALIGTWMGVLAVRYLMGIDCPEDILKIDGANAQMTTVSIKRDETCPLHYPIGESKKIGITNQHSLEELKNQLSDGSNPLLWEPIQYLAECQQCGFQEDRWQVARIEICPNCGWELRPRTTVDLSKAPPEIKLETLGIPPKEILPVFNEEVVSWVEIQ